MLDPHEFFTWDASENKAIAQLVPALDEAVASGRPVNVVRFPTPCTNAQLVALAVGVVKRAEVNVAVLAGAGQQALTFVPLAVTLRMRAKRPRTTQREPVVARGEVLA